MKITKMVLAVALMASSVEFAGAAPVTEVATNTTTTLQLPPPPPRPPLPRIFGGGRHNVRHRYVRHRRYVRHSSGGLHIHLPPPPPRPPLP